MKESNSHATVVLETPARIQEHNGTFVARQSLIIMREFTNVIHTGHTARCFHLHIL